jgi:hypothetical protein
MDPHTRPLFVLYVVWHPNFAAGATMADELRQHFRRKLYENVAGGTGLSVIFRSTPAPGEPVPLPIDLDGADTTAIIVLGETTLARDAEWVKYIQTLAANTEEAGLSARIFPIAVDREALNIGLAEQALRWDQWVGTETELKQRLVSELALEFCRMLRYFLEHLEHAMEDEEALEKYLQKVQIFLSHSKH